jgi:hypothetical protein
MDTRMDLIIVRRALSPAYYFFLQTFAATNRLALLQDRRIDERRRQLMRKFGDRRHGDRRGAEPPTWSQGDFIVVRARKDA